MLMMYVNKAQYEAFLKAGIPAAQMVLVGKIPTQRKPRNV